MGSDHGNCGGLAIEPTAADRWDYRRGNGGGQRNRPIKIVCSDGFEDELNIPGEGRTRGWRKFTSASGVNGWNPAPGSEEGNFYLRGVRETLLASEFASRLNWLNFAGRPPAPGLAEQGF